MVPVFGRSEQVRNIDFSSSIESNEENEDGWRHVRYRRNRRKKRNSAVSESARSDWRGPRYSRKYGPTMQPNRRLGKPPTANRQTRYRRTREDEENPAHVVRNRSDDYHGGNNRYSILIDYSDEEDTRKTTKGKLNYVKKRGGKTRRSVPRSGESDEDFGPRKNFATSNGDFREPHRDLGFQSRRDDARWIRPDETDFSTYRTSKSDP